MSILSPETRALLDQARSEETMPRACRAEIRQRLVVALGVAAPMALSATAAASVSAATWAVRGLAAVGAAGVVTAAVLVPFPAALPPARPVTIHVASQSAVTAERPPRVPPRALALPAPSASPSAASYVDAPLSAPSSHLRVPAPRVAPPPTLISFDPPARGSTSVVERAPRPEATEDLLLSEVRLVGDARVAIQGGSALQALEILAQHDQRFPGGALTPETSALRVDALCAVGRVADAEVEVSRFRERYPGSPLARRFASTCARTAGSAATPGDR